MSLGLIYGAYRVIATTAEGIGNLGKRHYGPTTDEEIAELISADNKWKKQHPFQSLFSELLGWIPTIITWTLIIGVFVLLLIFSRH